MPRFLRVSVGLVFASTFAVAGCGSGTPSTTLPILGPSSAATSADAATSAPFTMCSLVPSGDVSGAAPFTIPLVDSKPFSGAPQGCTYSFQGSQQYASVGLDVTDFPTPDLARAALANHDQVARQNLGETPQPVSGIGDQADVVAGGDEVNLEAVTGSRVLDVSLSGQAPDITPGQKTTAAEALARLVLARLP